MGKLIACIKFVIRENHNQIESVLYHARITEILENVRRFAFEEKKDPTFSKARIDNLLDKILDFQQKLVKQNDKIDTLIEGIEQLTWFTDLDDVSLMTIDELIFSTRDLHSSLLKQYIIMNELRTKGSAKDVIKEHQASLDDLKDVAADLDSRFFFLPNLPDFRQTTNELSLI